MDNKPAACLPMDKSRGFTRESVTANQHQMKLLGQPSISGQFPLTFEDTGFKMQTIDFTCGNCESPIPTDSVHGTISRLIKRVIDMDLMGRCTKCGMATPFKIRVHSDRRCDWFSTETGKWQSEYIYPPNRHGVKAAFMDMLKAIKQRLFGGANE